MRSASKEPFRRRISTWQYLADHRTPNSPVPSCPHCRKPGALWKHLPSRGGCSLIPHTGYRGRSLGILSKTPSFVVPPRVQKCRQGKGEKFGDSGTLRVKSQLCHSGPRVDKDRVHALGWCSSMFKSTHSHGSSSCTFR